MKLDTCYFTYSADINSILHTQSMIAKEFPDNIAFMFALLETFFGVGMICGPTVGGALYELGGFTLPFASLGSK